MNFKRTNVLVNIGEMGAGYLSSQIAKTSDDELDTLLRFVGATVASGIILPQGSNGLISLGAAVANSVHGYQRSGGSVPYAILWALSSDVGLGLALGQGFGKLPKPKKK